MAPGGDERRRRSFASNLGSQTSGRPTCDAVRARRLLRAARRGDRGARERVVISHLGLVQSIASRYRDLGLPLDDLVQEGTLGLLEAVDRYDSDRGGDFASYARFRVRRSIRNALTDQSRLIRLPKQIVERRRAIGRAEARLVAAANGRAPTPAELAEASGLPVRAVFEAGTAGLSPVSLEDPVLPEGTVLEALIMDPAARDPQTKLLERADAESVRAAFAALPRRQRLILARRLGLDGEPRTTHQVAAEIGLSPRRTQTIAGDALHCLRAALTESRPERSGRLDAPPRRSVVPPSRSASTS
jgi:RNA polymerase primary sigma factor